VVLYFYPHGKNVLRQRGRISVPRTRPRYHAHASAFTRLILQRARGFRRAGNRGRLVAVGTCRQRTYAEQRSAQPLRAVRD
jgi:hypothetical protein